MNKAEFDDWQAITQASTHQWVEDSITRLNGNGGLYYTGGEDGCYICISPDGNLTAGTYEGAFPHIGEAIFTRKVEQQYPDFNSAFEAACKLGGRQFLADMFSQDAVPQAQTPDDEAGMTFEMKM